MQKQDTRRAKTQAREAAWTEAERKGTEETEQRGIEREGAKKAAAGREETERAVVLQAGKEWAMREPEGQS